MERGLDFLTVDLQKVKTDLDLKADNAGCVQNLGEAMPNLWPTLWPSPNLPFLPVMKEKTITLL